MAPNTATGINTGAGSRESGTGLRRRSVPRFRFPVAGFTIIELLIVMTLIIILASVGMTQYRNSVTRAEEAVLKENLFRMRDAMDQFYADKNKWPADLAELVSAGYIREIPEDSMTKSKDTWQTETAEPDANNPASAGGISNVHSGSDRTALDGTRYAEWN
jgi:general secretion pathway protein G